jgi:hypothetical protein
VEYTAYLTPLYSDYGIPWKYRLCHRRIHGIR